MHVALMREVLAVNQHEDRLETIKSYGIMARGKSTVYMWECMTDQSAYALFNVLLMLYHSKVPMPEFVKQLPDGSAEEVVAVERMKPSDHFDVYGVFDAHKMPKRDQLYTSLRALAKGEAKSRDPSYYVSRARVYVQDVEPLGYLNRDNE